jgi:hypothetical protein
LVFGGRIADVVDDAIRDVVNQESESLSRSEKLKRAIPVTSPNHHTVSGDREDGAWAGRFGLTGAEESNHPQG